MCVFVLYHLHPESKICLYLHVHISNSLILSRRFICLTRGSLFNAVHDVHYTNCLDIIRSYEFINYLKHVVMLLFYEQSISVVAKNLCPCTVLC